METAFFSSGIALGFGILHALEPGHGKTALLAYLASGKRTWADGLVLSLSSAITHSLAVFCIAFASHYLFHHGSMDTRIHLIESSLHLVSGALIIGLGVWIIWKGRKSEKPHACSSCSHHHQPPTKPIKRRFFASGILGIATGIIPCPTVVVAYLSGLSTGNSFLGMQSVLLFALGMSLTLMSVVILFSIGVFKIRKRVKPNKKLLNWSYIQGSVFIVIGVLTALFH